MNAQAAEFVRPRIVISKCLGFEACRWDGQCIDDPFVKLLAPHVECVTVCPECAIGLGVPRRPVRIVRGEGTSGRLVQPATGRDMTPEMKRFCSEFFGSLGPVDGFLLKFKSPSCGLSHVNVYHSADDGNTDWHGAGMFAEAVKERYPDHPSEDEGRLRNFVIRENWLTGIHVLAKFRMVKADGTMGGLVQFHSDHKYLFMAQSQGGLRALGRLVANHGKLPAPEVFQGYELILRGMWKKVPRETSRINVLLHIFGHFSDRLTPAEREHFLDVLEDYRRGGMPLSVPVTILKSWALRFEEGYIQRQRFLAPFPEELGIITDSGLGRTLR